MSAEVLTYPCAGCGASMSFDAATQGLACPQCGGKTPVALPRTELEEQDLEAALAAGEGKAAEPGSRRLKCPGCAAEIRASEGLEARPCPFCGAAEVMADVPGDGVLPPEGVLPFKVDRSASSEIFRKWVSSRWFAPSALKKLSRAELLRGVYVPFWTFDASADSSWTALSGTYYYTTETYRDAQGNTHVREVRHVRWWPSSGRHAGAYDDVPVCASRGLPDALLSGIEPFDLKAAAAYEPKCLAGWEAEACQVALRDAWTTASGRMRTAEERACDAQVPGDTHMGLSVRTALSDLRFKPILLPVWIAAYRYGEKDYRFLVNGMTGAVKGESPWSAWKVSIAAAVVLGLTALGIWLANR